MVEKDQNLARFRSKIDVYNEGRYNICYMRFVTEKEKNPYKEWRFYTKRL